MQALFLVGPIPINGHDALSFITNSNPLISGPFSWNRNRRSHRCNPRIASSSSSAAINGEQDHYALLGITRRATSADIKKAYRLLARKVLSNEATRTQYDRVLKFQEDTCGSFGGKWNYRSEYDDGVKIYRWAELRRKMQQERSWEQHNANEESSSFYGETDEVASEGNLDQERGPFIEVLRSAFISLFLLQTFGSRLSLTISSLLALFDHKLDSGYKIGYVIAWILGGRGGILLTLCLSFASWVCGKTSSSVVTLVMVAMWVGSNLARYAPLPQGALLTLLYMSIKLQVDLN
ncbi:DnaJ domain-containing protein [Cephalotus follicularis]|uniref:DnaJ domain-containing protein n=1 Tax=Cephalotus follicularis TaxID=3775 RepID=A0A1Q3DJ23_CEPFO|nr:DnaJ domain-containing protein [Cephalotus follicularis]